METFYKAYTKISQNKLTYFVKKYQCFPEYENVEDILEGYGMHTDFEKACSIAGVHDPQIRKQLLDAIEAAVPQAKIIDLNAADAVLVKKISS